MGHKKRQEILKQKKAGIYLSDGSFFQGFAFGADASVQAELVFHTGHSGYPEILTDPSYCQQAIVFSASQIGNQGVHKDDFESDQVWAAAAICRDYMGAAKHWRKQMSLHELLKSHGVPGVYGVDTRRLILKLREAGNQWALISTETSSKLKLAKRFDSTMSMEGRGLVSEVSCKKAYTFSEHSSDLIRNSFAAELKKKCVVLDFGVKKQILRYLKDVGFAEVRVLPSTATAKEVLAEEPDAILLSNGPGDPAAETQIVSEVKKLHGSVPILGICLGHQLLALSFGLKTSKLRFGHHAANHPVLNKTSGFVEISSQNHGFEVLADKSELDFCTTNLNDQSVAGFVHTKLPIKGIQYHPESSPGPMDSREVFDELFAGEFR